MSKVFYAIVAIALFSCHAEEQKQADDKTAATSTTAPYTATYSSKFEMGDSKNTDVILNAWKAWDDGNLQSVRKVFADSMNFYLRDGNKLQGPTDSTLASAQQYRNTFASVKSSVIAIVPLKSTDKNEQWVAIWGVETSTDKQGKVDSVGLQESWHFNKDGKIDILYQYGQGLTPPAMTK